MTVFAAESHARTFGDGAGDVGYVPHVMGHYVENTGATPLRFLELFRSRRYADVSLGQWLALTPPALVRARLHLDDATRARLRPRKQPVAGSPAARG
jgi:oxalate decarboxylase